MASIQAGLVNPLGSPREFGSPQVAREARMLNVFEAGAPVQVSSAAAVAVAPEGSPAAPSATFHKTRDPKSPQTRNALWEPLHDWTQPDESDAFPHLAGGEAGVIAAAGHGRVKKRSNLTEIDFYTKLSEPDVQSFAPQFGGSHISDGSDWTHFVILEDLTAPFSKPTILDLQIGQEHAGSGDPGTAPSIGLRINGMRQNSNAGVVHRDKEWGGQVQTKHITGELEEFLTDAARNLHPEVAGTVVSFIDELWPWVEAQKGLRLVGTSLLIVYEGDTTVFNAPAPVVKMVDFKDVRVEDNDLCDEGFLTGLRNLRWMLERMVAYCELEAARKDTRDGQSELRAAKLALQKASKKCSSAKDRCVALSPEKSLHAKVLHEDIIKEDVGREVMQQEDNVIAAFLKAVLAKHKINSGHDAFVELLQWRHQPLIMDRVYVVDLCDRYGLSTAASEDLLKWKETSDTRMRELRYMYDAKLSAAPVLPSYYDLLVKQDEVQGMLAQ